MAQKFDTVSLSKCKSAIPVIAQWFCYQWADWYGPEGPGNAIADLEEWALMETPCLWLGWLSPLMVSLLA